MTTKEIPIYNPAKIEKKWQDKWEEDGLYYSDIDHDKNKILCINNVTLSLRRSTYRPLVCHDPI